MVDKQSTSRGVIKSLGLVFGDIGTSPIYTITVVFLLLAPTEENIIGVLSIMIWTLITLVTLQYAWLAMSLSRRGEGGDIVIREIFLSLVGKRHRLKTLGILPIIGVSLLIGDGVITPAISILSAVEGLLLVPGFEGLSGNAIVLISAVIAVALFSIQSHGTEKVAGAFGPIMVIWFSSLTLIGINGILQAPQVLKAFNPYYGLGFLFGGGLKSFIALGEIILCATGGEAMYADMGHLGRKPISRAWLFVFAALVVNYLGQGAYLLTHTGARNILFEMVFNTASALYVPFLLLSVTATIIASQAMISGMFSIVYQGITTRLMPMFAVDYTSVERKSQIYIGSVNWSLLFAVIFIMIQFGASHKLAAAYGFAVTGTMLITSAMMTMIFALRKKPLLSVASAAIGVIDLVYFIANMFKLPHGGYWSIVLAIAPFAMIMLYTSGQRRLYRMMDFMPLDDFLIKFNRVYSTSERIGGTVLFLLKDVKEIPFYITQTMFYHGIIYKDNIFISVIKRDDPYGITGFFREDLAPGLRVFEIQMGYMEVIDVEELLREADISERVVFYGLEDISSKNIIWKAFSVVKRLSPPFIKFYKFPPRKLHGVLTKVSM